MQVSQGCANLAPLLALPPHNLCASPLCRDLGNPNLWWLAFASPGNIICGDGPEYHGDVEPLPAASQGIAKAIRNNMAAQKEVSMYMSHHFYQWDPEDELK